MIRIIIILTLAMLAVALSWPDPRDTQEAVAQAVYFPLAHEVGND